MTHRIVTIDGPAGAGKSTVSRLLAKSLGWVRVDTGALYRGVAYEIAARQVAWKNPTRLTQFLSTVSFQLVRNKDELVLLSAGRDITPYLRSHDITMLASAVSAVPAVRSTLLDIQRAIGRQQDAVFEGRDMGTVVFPDASVKFF